MTIAGESFEMSNVRFLLREGARRFGLPFGVLGKQRDLAAAYATGRLADVRFVVLQDVTLLYPPELIFGLEPGDCACVQVWHLAGIVAVASVEHLVAQYDPTHIVVAGSSAPNFKADFAVQEAIQALQKGSELIRQRVKQGLLSLEGCVVDAGRRTVEFL